MGISYKTNYVSGQNFQKSFFTKVFCSWDYALTEKNSAAMKSKNIYQDLMVWFSFVSLHTFWPKCSGIMEALGSLRNFI